MIDKTPPNENKAKLSYSADDDPFPKKLLISAIEYATGRRRLEKIYNKIKQSDNSNNQIWQLILQELSINVIYDKTKLLKVPRSGPIIFIANHPFGVVDGAMLCYLASEVRQKFFVLANEVLCKEKIIADYMLPIDFRTTKEALQTNIDTRKKAIERLNDGEALVIFPAGGVATSRKILGKADDLNWKRFVVKLIHKTKAPVIPIYFYGQNSRLFQFASHVHMSLRLSLLLHEVRNKMGQSLKVSIGDPILYNTIEHIKNRQELLDHLRKITYELGQS